MSHKRTPEDALDVLNSFAKLKQRKLGIYRNSEEGHDLSLGFNSEKEDFDLLEIKENVEYPQTAQEPPPTISFKVKAQQFGKGGGKESISSGLLEKKKAVLFDGSTMKFNYDRLRRLQDSIPKPRNERLETGVSLLKRSVFRLMDEIEAENISKVAADIETSMEVPDETPTNSKDSVLFVDKYRPEAYIDLLSENWINQQVLLWIKQWDPCVFGRAPSERLKKILQITRDKHERPSKKILLLSGPPGLGKTTMVNVLAKQCGYDVIEINASDERTGDVVINQVKNAVETREIFKNQKPNLILIDEIDGALGGASDTSFIKMLLDLVNPSRSSKKKKKEIYLRRPIICVCNDPYVPALRPLRAIAQIYNFRKPENTVIVKRLKAICEKEDLKTDTRALTLLVEKAEGDIRTCLNTLQILKAKLKKQHRTEISFGETKKTKPGITYDLVNTMPIGEKDFQKSIFSIWETVFHLDCDKSLQLLDGNAEQDIIMVGCFENYLKMDFRDTSVSGSNINKLLEYVAYYDFFLESVYRGNSLGTIYLPYMINSFNIYTKHLGIKKKDLIIFPRNSIECRKLMKSNYQMILGFIQHSDARTKQWLNASHFASSTISPLLRIISPRIRPVNPELLKINEKQVLNRLVNIMAELGLNYVTERKHEGTLTMRLDPPIETLICFENDYHLKQFMNSNYSVRKVIAEQIEKEISRREIKSVSKSQTDKEKEMRIDIKPKSGKIAKGKDINQLLKTQKKLVPKDFFGRDIVSAVLTPITSQNEKAPTFVFKYHEGFSNAVRRPAIINEFIKFSE